MLCLDYVYVYSEQCRLLELSHTYTVTHSILLYCCTFQTPTGCLLLFDVPVRVRFCDVARQVFSGCKTADVSISMSATIAFKFSAVWECNVKI